MREFGGLQLPGAYRARAVASLRVVQRSGKRRAADAVLRSGIRRADAQFGGASMPLFKTAAVRCTWVPKAAYSATSAGLHSRTAASQAGTQAWHDHETPLDMLLRCTASSRRGRPAAPRRTSGSHRNGASRAGR